MSNDFPLDGRRAPNWKQKQITFSAVTAFVGLKIQAIGSLAYYKVAVAAGGDMTLSGDDVDGTTSLFAIDLSTPAAGVDTFGELKDYINGTCGAHFRCDLVGVLGSESTDNTLATLSAAHLKTGATVTVQNEGLELYLDQAVLLDLGFSISNQRFWMQPNEGYDSALVGRTTDFNVENELEYINVNLTQTNAGTWKIYECDDTPGVNSSTLRYSNAYVSATAEEHPSSTGAYNFSVSRGKRMCVKFDAVDTAATACDVRARGKTTHLTGGQVFGGNYAGCV